MLAAAANGLVDKVKEAIEKKIDINAKHSDFVSYSWLFSNNKGIAH